MKKLILLSILLVSFSASSDKHLYKINMSETNTGSTILVGDYESSGESVVYPKCGVSDIRITFDQLRTKIENGEDVTTVCTDAITSMYDLFYEIENFSQDISNWDVSNVTEMDWMFEYTINFSANMSGFQAQAKDTRFENSFYVIHFNQELTFSGYDSIMSQEKRKGNLITLLSSHLLITDLNNELNKHAQMYNSRYKVIKTHQSYNRIYEIK